ncbi:MAG: TatD family hydrolase [bacterium]|nr:TatD family hydrolase [bacterium]MDZ4248322.1 TatD family hydrolase [Patescibacteria group bacterium]
MSDLNLVDTHAHLDFDQFAEDRGQVLARATAAGVTRLINVGTSLAASERCIELATAHENVWAAAGVHPSESGELVAEDGTVKPDAAARLRKLAHHERVVAIGEIGFDLFRDTNPSEELQLAAFHAQGEIAQEAGLPVIIHLRAATEPALDTLVGHVCAAAADPSRRHPGVAHCYTGGLADAKRLLQAGYYISFTAPITYPKNYALREVVKAVPLEKIMVETDCPFLPPPALRGQRNEPAYVVKTAKKIAELKGISLEEVADATTANAERLFGIA